jgi:hypothetical protein
MGKDPNASESTSNPKHTTMFWVTICLSIYFGIAALVAVGAAFFKVHGPTFYQDLRQKHGSCLGGILYILAYIGLGLLWPIWGLCGVGKTSSRLRCPAYVCY